jgi:preprotein translocase subunit SecB
MDTGTSSINAVMQFYSYKIDTFSYTMKKDFNLLQINAPINPICWDINMSIRIPEFHKVHDKYICGMDVIVSLHDSNIEERDRNESNALLKMNAGIAGIFGFDNSSEVSNDLKLKLIKVQAFAILLPYLRGSVTAFVANSGFGTFIFPLINVQNMAEVYLKDLDIKVIE